MPEGASATGTVTSLDKELSDLPERRKELLRGAREGRAGQCCQATWSSLLLHPAGAAACPAMATTAPGADFFQLAGWRVAILSLWEIPSDGAAESLLITSSLLVI